MTMFRLPSLDILAAALLAFAMHASHAAEPGEATGAGIRPSTLAAPQWQVRLTLAGEPHLLWREAGPPGKQHLSLFGDYYLPHAWGLRATGGVLLGHASMAGSPRTGGSPGRLFNLQSAPPSSSWGADVPGAQEGRATPAATPYLGLGYTGSTAHGSLGFFADVGLQGLKPRSGVRLGAEASGSSHREVDAENWRPWREWRFMPILQLGVSYAF